MGTGAVQGKIRGFMRRGDVLEGGRAEARVRLKVVASAQGVLVGGPSNTNSVPSFSASDASKAGSEDEG